MENYNDLEQMRQEIVSLREKLDRQVIINEEHVRRSMYDKVRNIRFQTASISDFHSFWQLQLTSFLSLQSSIQSCRFGNCILRI